jgi:hypothetical protein
MFDHIETNMSDKSKVIKGGSNDTEPYNTFRSGLNRIYDYFSVIFVNNKTNNEKYQESVENLDKPCDCSKYKCKNDENEVDEEEEEEEEEEEDEEQEEAEADKNKDEQEQAEADKNKDEQEEAEAEAEADSEDENNEKKNQSGEETDLGEKLILKGDKLK